MGVINVRSTLELKGCLEEDKTIICNVVRGSGIVATFEEDVIFLDSMFDNENNFAESLALLISHKLPLGHEDIIMVVEGGDITDRYDIIIRQNKVFIQYYELVPGELVPYTE